ncbi:hypothetical protein Tco_0742192, partial [Tanacetum coccineum]
LGQVGIIEGDEEGLEDVMFKLESNLDVLAWSWYAAAKKEEQGTIAKGIDAWVVVETAARDEVKMSAMGMVKVKFDRIMHPVVLDDVPKPAQEEGAVEVIYEALGDMVQRFHDHAMEIPSERISELKQDNTRLIDMLDVAIQRVTQIQRREMRVQREMRQIRHF